ncbi:MAG: 3-hydroxybutyryl-CoA dehydrogenase [Bacteroidota bacterium]
MLHIGVIGAGAMGSGIAQVAATHGHSVVLSDTSQVQLDKSKQSLAVVLGKLVEKGKMSREQADEIAGRIRYAVQLEELADCGLVIEAIVEKLDIKKQVFSSLEAIVSPSCILATNTSSLSVASIAAACIRAERVIGLHFFNPAPLMPLVEVIPAIQTRADLPSEMKELMLGWNKSPVIVKDTPGFIVNRVARPFYGEALRIYEEGIADFATIDRAMKELGGFRMGPFELMDFIGNDVNYAVTASVFESFYFDPRYKPSLTQRRYAEAGWLGRKTGRGYYTYGDGAVMPEGVNDRALQERILHRILVMLINEAADALYLNIANASDIDASMTKGVNYPKGLLQWADELGVATVVDSLDELYDTYREDRYRCSVLLRRKAEEGTRFFS